MKIAKELAAGLRALCDTPEFAQHNWDIRYIERKGQHHDEYADLTFKFVPGAKWCVTLRAQYSAAERKANDHPFERLVWLDKNGVVLIYENGMF